MIRAATAEDLEAIHKLAPERIHELRPDESTLVSLVALKDEEIVAYGAVKVFAEAVFAVNQSASKFTRASVVKKLFDVGVGQCRRLHVEELHTFTGDPEFQKFLESYGFVAVPEKALSLRLR